ncbi:MAG: glucosidase [Terrimicrobiaceae bacterium]
MSGTLAGAEAARLRARDARAADWGRWGPYLPERQWGTVREDYSADGNAWTAFPFEHAHLRAYRWGEDGLLGWCDRKCRLCFSFSLWNGRDPVLKERFFGLTNAQGNHGEDVKELYFYLDGTPTHSYNRALYKYPVAEFPYEELIQRNRRPRTEDEWEIEDTAAFQAGHFDVTIEYAKGEPDEAIMRLTAVNRSDATQQLTVLPTLWFRNTWSWGDILLEETLKPGMSWEEGAIVCHHETLGDFECRCPDASGAPVFTDNETASRQLYGVTDGPEFTKDAIGRLVLEGDGGAVNPRRQGTKAAWVIAWDLAPGESRQVDVILRPPGGGPPDPDAIVALRRAEADAHWEGLSGVHGHELKIYKQAMAGLFWSKKFYYYVVREWVTGDPAQPSPPPGREKIRNGPWRNFMGRNLFLMPDNWEYPWFAAWDLAFHAVAVAHADPALAKDQILLLCRESYMRNNGHIPAYEWEFSDVNPPVQAWAAWRIYKEGATAGRPDRDFLERVFHKLLLNFTWWVNRKDREGNNLFGGGFLGLDNIGVFDRSKPLPGGGHLEQADGTAWVGIYCVYMLQIAIELALDQPVYEDMASKFFEHFVEIVDAMNEVGGGLWDEEEGFYFDRLQMEGRQVPLKTYSMVGLLPLAATIRISERTLKALPGFRKQFEWFLANRHDLSGHVQALNILGGEDLAMERLIALVPRSRLERVLGRLFNEEEFLSPFGIRSLSKHHLDHPFSLNCGLTEGDVRYLPGESDNGLFGGNSNWRGPVWFPVNVILLGALRRFHEFYGAGVRVSLPGLGKVTLGVAADEIEHRLCRLFAASPADGLRPAMGSLNRYRNQPGWDDLILFHEYFHAETGRGLGASHQTGWTALVARMLRSRQERV